MNDETAKHSPKQRNITAAGEPRIDSIRTGDNDWIKQNLVFIRYSSIRSWATVMVVPLVDAESKDIFHSSFPESSFRNSLLMTLSSSKNSFLDLQLRDALQIFEQH
jgi:hypothetical protein